MDVITQLITGRCPHGFIDTSHRYVISASGVPEKHVSMDNA